MGLSGEEGLISGLSLTMFHVKQISQKGNNIEEAMGGFYFGIRF
jgi:hypothetical protein